MNEFTRLIHEGKLHKEITQHYYAPTKINEVISKPNPDYKDYLEQNRNLQKQSDLHSEMSFKT